MPFFAPFVKYLYLAMKGGKNGKVREMSRNIKKAFRCKCSIKINFFSFFFTSPCHVVVGNFLRAFSSSLVSQRAFSVEKFRFIDCA